MLAVGLLNSTLQSMDLTTPLFGYQERIFDGRWEPLIGRALQATSWASNVRALGAQGSEHRRAFLA